MTPGRIFTAAILALGLAGCVTTTGGVEPASRAAATPATDAAAMAMPAIKVRRVVVDVPRTLEVNESNLYFPTGDIVWREDPAGDRHAQVARIVEDGLRAGAARLSGNKLVDLHVEVVKFHALSEKARRSVGGLHAIRFQATLVDPATGQALTRPWLVTADFEAYGGRKAAEADARGLTQKSRIQQQLAHVIEVELTRPGGYSAQTSAFFAALHKL